MLVPSKSIYLAFDPGSVSAKTSVTSNAPERGRWVFNPLPSFALAQEQEAI